MKDTKTASPVDTPTSAPGAPAAEQVLKALAKLVSGRKIYADNNPRLAQFRDEMATALREFFALEDELVLTVEQFAIHWNERVDMRRQTHIRLNRRWSLRMNKIWHCGKLSAQCLHRKHIHPFYFKV